ncbi:MAG: alpha/beta hydrolase [Pantoea sp.]|uniref:alpha/beta fold hydrolase n=1 Tax=Pantoea septica TaxID=472695 RepID=UPI001C0F6587|nr:alpha/beta hydrolase [Pantoea septica]MBU5379244.1 alpha/beta hydrolase [Pantoea septica]MDU5837235.1 alpha/beta hydrolase [Pantoea sp.]MDU6438717.1 alpha/beta hydrolase [Pantoea sp.]
MMRKTQRLSNSQMRVSYLEAGQGAPLVLIHGVGMNAEVWYPQIEALSARFRVIAVDMPGHGESDAFSRSVSLPDYVAWLAELLDQRPEARFAVAGHSMGALIAAGLAIDYPERVSHAIVMSGVYRRSDAARQAVLRRAQELAAGSADLDSPLARWFGDDEREAALRERVGCWLQQVNLQGYADAYQAFASGDEVYADRWDEMACPVLVLTGELDANSNPQMARAMAAAAPQGQAIVVANARHMVSLTDAERVSQEMMTFLTAPAAAEKQINALAGVSHADR